MADEEKIIDPTQTPEVQPVPVPAVPAGRFPFYHKSLQLHLQRQRG